MEYYIGGKTPQSPKLSAPSPAFLLTYPTPILSTALEMAISNTAFAGSIPDV